MIFLRTEESVALEVLKFKFIYQLLPTKWPYLGLHEYKWYKEAYSCLNSIRSVAPNSNQGMSKQVMTSEVVVSVDR